MQPISIQTTSDILAELTELETRIMPILPEIDSVCIIESADPLQALNARVVVAQISNSGTGQKIFGQFKFIVHYLAVSSTVFAILLVATNYSAYSSIVMNYLKPGELEVTSGQIAATLNASKISVFANAENTLSAEEQKIHADEIKAQLNAENVVVSEDPFSMQQLIPRKPKIEANFAITPYENRLIIPKIGKNIPLVDVPGINTFDFDHMENIFMQELEKGVVRYPGTALPGEKGNAFIFGHSSNYPWVKGEYNEVFALLDELEYGDQIIVYYNQKKFIYTIREKKVVHPGDVKALERHDDKAEISLMTCWPVGTTLKRMLVFAELTPQ